MPDADITLDADKIFANLGAGGGSRSLALALLE